MKVATIEMIRGLTTQTQFQSIWCDSFKPTNSNVSKSVKEILGSTGNPLFVDLRFSHIQTEEKIRG